MLILTNHELNHDQRADAQNVLSVENFLYAPENIKEYWKNIPPQGLLEPQKLEPILQWIRKASVPGDYILIQGEFGASFYLVSFVFTIDRIPVYATTERKYSEIKNKSGAVERKHIFKHVQFRRYINAL